MRRCTLILSRILVPCVAIAAAACSGGNSSGGASSTAHAAGTPQVTKTVTVAPSPAPSTTNPSTPAVVPAPVPSHSAVGQQQGQPGCAPLTSTAASAIGGTIAQYFDGIESGNYAEAWGDLTPANQSHSSYAQFAAALQSSTDTDVTFRGEFVTSGCQDVAEVTFTSHQAPQYAPNGTDTCDTWDLYYVMIHQPGGYYLIDSAQPANGAGGWSSC
jgi:hypothetical protein